MKKTVLFSSLIIVNLTFIMVDFAWAMEESKTMKLVMMVSYDDEVNVSGQTEQVLLDRLFGNIKEAGFRAVMWRSMRGGQAMFKSRQYKIFYPSNFAKFNPMAAAKKKAKELGLEFMVWHEVRGAEAHGWGLHSAFVKEHPELLSKNRLNMTSKAELSWAAPEVMRRRVVNFEDVLAYEPDAIWIDHVTQSDVSVPIFDKEGYFSMGYDKYMVEGFKTLTGREPWQIPNNEPQWLHFRASYVTEYMRKSRKIQQQTHPNTKIGLLGASIGNTHTIWYLPLKNSSDPNLRKTATLVSPLANLEDHDTWTREGLIDVLCAPHRTFSTVEELKTIILDARTYIHGACQFAVQVWPSNPALIRDYARIAHEHGAAYLVVRESYAMYDKPVLWNACKQAAQRYSKAR